MIQLANAAMTRKILLSDRVMQRIQDFASLEYPYECGGVLVGRFRSSDGTPVIHDCSAPPADSKAHRTHFERGTEELQVYLNSQFSMGFQYVGEWHTHPSGSPTPSFVDRRTMFRIGCDHSYQMPRPILLIAGGTPSSGWSVMAWRSRYWIRPEGYGR